MKNLKLISLIISNVMLVIFGLTITISAISNEQEMVFNQIFGGPTSELINVSEDEEDTIYYKTWYSNVKDVMDGNDAVSAAVMAEGTVLLKNDNNALPLAKDDKVSLFGVTAYEPIYSMNGGATKVTPNADRRQDYQSVLKNVGLDVNADIAHWYKDNSATYFHSSVGGNGSFPTLNGAPWSAIQSANILPSSDGGTAIFVFGRVGNEGADVKFAGDGYGSTSNYLELTETEKGVLAGLKQAKENGQYSKILVIINATNVMQEDFAKIFKENDVDSALWIGTPGTGGLSGVASVIVGKSTPSGRLSDMWYSSTTNNPSTANYISTGTADHNHAYVLYQEGVYVGYRYAETRYEDYVMGSENAGYYDYSSQVTYPFGYGLSYATFEYSDCTIVRPTVQDGIYTIKVKVTNTSADYSGKEVVQIYLQKPYTTYDVDKKIEKPSAELVAFAKTSKLAPGASETVSINVNANKYFSDFDAYGKGTYILQAGDYYLTVAKNSHDATNNFLAGKGHTHASTGLKMDFDGNADLTQKITINSATESTYSYKTNTGTAVTSLFDNADPNRVDPSAPAVTFMSRNNWESTVSTSRTTVASSALRDEQRAYDRNQMVTRNDSVDYPTYSKIPDNGYIPLIDMRLDDKGEPLKYDDPKWDTFLDQLSWEESVYMVSNGWRMTAALPSVSKPAVSSPNGPLGFNWKYNYMAGEKYQLPGFAGKTSDENQNSKCVGYPAHCMIASTFNIDLAYAVGQAYGEDALWAGFSGIFGFGLNLHRNPYGGRNGEYYSDDAVLSGIIAGYMTKGCQSKGCHVYNKHFVLNDMDHNRTSPYETWITEQTIRQQYLRVFELAIEIGDASNVMISFTRIGSRVACSNKNLLTDYLRGECGMKGYAITDGGYSQGYGMGIVQGVLSGNDLPDGSLNGATLNADNSVTIGSGNEFYGKDPTSGGYGHVAQAMRESVHRIMYITVNSSAMNYFNSGTKVISHPASWVSAVKTIVVSVSVVFGLSVLFTVAMVSLEIYKKKSITSFKG